MGYNAQICLHGAAWGTLDLDCQQRRSFGHVRCLSSVWLSPLEGCWMALGARMCCPVPRLQAWQPGWLKRCCGPWRCLLAVIMAQAKILWRVRSLTAWCAAEHCPSCPGPAWRWWGRQRSSAAAAASQLTRWGSWKREAWLARVVPARLPCLGDCLCTAPMQERRGHAINAILPCNAFACQCYSQFCA